MVGRSGAVRTAIGFSSHIMNQSPPTSPPLNGPKKHMFDDLKQVEWILSRAFDLMLKSYIHYVEFGICCQVFKQLYDFLCFYFVTVKTISTALIL